MWLLKGLTGVAGTYPAFAFKRDIGFALTASPFLKDQKGTKKSSPHRTAFAALRFPRSGSAPWARRHGPSMAHRGSPGIHAGRPTPQNLLSASREGRQIKSTATPRRPTCLAARSVSPEYLLCGSGLARDASGAVFQLNRVDAIAGKLACTLNASAKVG